MNAELTSVQRMIEKHSTSENWELVAAYVTVASILADQLSQSLNSSLDVLESSR